MALVATALVCQAQQPASQLQPMKLQNVQQPPEKEKGTRIRGLIFQPEMNLPEVFAHDPAAQKPGPGVAVHAKNYLNHEGANMVFIGRDVVFTKSANPESMRSPAEVIARASMPGAQLKSGVFLFLPGSGKAGEPMARVLIIDDSRSEFPPGALKMVNLSRLPVRVQLESQNFDFKSGEIRNIENQPVGDNNVSGMRAFSFHDGQWQRIGAGMWPPPGSKRVIQLMYENPATGNVEIRGIRDITSVL